MTQTTRAIRERPTSGSKVSIPIRGARRTSNLRQPVDSPGNRRKAHRRNRVGASSSLHNSNRQIIRSNRHRADTARTPSTVSNLVNTGSSQISTDPLPANTGSRAARNTDRHRAKAISTDPRPASSVNPDSKVSSVNPHMVAISLRP